MRLQIVVEMFTMNAVPRFGVLGADVRIVEKARLNEAPKLAHELILAPIGRGS